MNSAHWSIMIYIVKGNLVSHAISTQFAIFIAFLYFYCAISNHPLTWSNIVADFISKGSLPFLCIL